MEAITNTIKNAIYGDSTATDKTTSVEDRSAYRGTSSNGAGDSHASSSVADDSTKFQPPESSKPQRSANPPNDSYNSGSDTAFRDAPNTGVLGGGSSSENYGPHDSTITNKADPRSESDRDDRATDTRTSGLGRSSTGISTTSSGGLTTETTGLGTDNPQSTNAGRHPSSPADKADSRVDPMRDNRKPPGTGAISPSDSGREEYGATYNKSTEGFEPSTSSLTSGASGEKGPTQTFSVTSQPSNEPTGFGNQARTNPVTSNVGEPEGLSGVPGGPGAAVEPSVGADPASGAPDEQKHQASDRPTEAPEGQPLGRRRSMVEDHPDNVGKSSTPESGERLPRSSKDDTAEKGDGTKYVKSTGVAAEGGDFDASRPGAGREADRLLEEAGVHRPQDSNKDTTRKSSDHDSKSSGDHNGSGEKSMGQKVKEKLHIGHKEGRKEGHKESHNE